MKIAVHDANILIDLVDAGLFETWCKTGLEMVATDLVRHEINHPKQRQILDNCVKRGILKIETLDTDALTEVVVCAGQNKISIADASAYHIAIRLKAILLTGDQKLKGVAETAGLETHGVIWVFEHLIAVKLLLPVEAAERLEKLLKQGSFLPRPVCEDCIKKWRSQV